MPSAKIYASTNRGNPAEANKTLPAKLALSRARWHSSSLEGSPQNCKARWFESTAWLFLFVAANAAAADPSMTGPEDIVPIGKSVWLEVDGVTVPELRGGNVSVYPSGYLESSHVRVLQDLRGTILVWVEIAKDNPLRQYDVVVTVARLEGEQPIIHRLAWTIKTGEAPNPPPGPDPPPAPIQWKVSGLHVLVIDDENQRGKLPQSQINIFTSKPLRDWMDAHAAKESDGRPAYRFSHPESLVDGSEGRKLELPVYVEGWDLLMESGTKLPAWIVSDGEREVIEPLPESVEAAIEKLEEFK